MTLHTSVARLAFALIAAVLTACAIPTAPPAEIVPWYSAVNERGDPIVAVYESRVPCANCARIKVALALYRDAKTSAPTTYSLALVYVAQSPEERIVFHGSWSLGQGTSLDPSASVVRLGDEAPVEFRNYWIIGERLLFILDNDLHPKVGTASYGYVLNRIR